MSRQKKKDTSKDDLVLTPGGPRPRERVTQVNSGKAVVFDSKGAPRVKNIESSEARKDKDMVLTPGGYRPSFLVRAVEQGHALRGVDGIVQVVDLSTDSIVDRVSSVTAVSEDIPALGSGWITYAYWNNGSGKSISSFKSLWRVPAEPSTRSGQTIFLFNGIQNYGNNYGILQPVLQWGSSAAGGGPFWAIASWYVTSSGQAFHTPLTRENIGDNLVGVMVLGGHSDIGFNYACEFEGIPSTRLPVQNIAELLWCNETLEAYSINQCSDYPGTQSTAFQKIKIEAAGASLPLKWTTVNRVTDCGQHTAVASNSPADGEVDIFYR